MQQQRELRLGDTLDDYCPRERRLTNHAVVAMIGDEVKQTRCTTCDAEHEYKHGRQPRPRKRPEAEGALAPPGQPVPKRIVPAVHEAAPESAEDGVRAEDTELPSRAPEPAVHQELSANGDGSNGDGVDNAVGGVDSGGVEEGPVHRRLIRATLPKIEGQPAQPRSAPDFTIRQPTGRTNRFRPRNARGAQPFQGRSGDNFGPRGSGRPNGGRPGGPHAQTRGGPGRKRSK